MAFWKKRIELPKTFYQSVGDCLLYFTESETSVQKIEASFMSVNNACELLGLVKEGLAKLENLIASFPIKSDTLMGLSDLAQDIRICDERKKALLAMTDLAPSEPLSSYHSQIGGYDTRQFQRSVINMQAMFGIQVQKAAKLMAKAANMSFSDFTTLAMRAVAATSRGQHAYAEAMRLQNTK